MGHSGSALEFRSFAPLGLTDGRNNWGQENISLPCRAAEWHKVLTITVQFPGRGEEVAGASQLTSSSTYSLVLLLESSSESNACARRLESGHDG